MKILSAVFTDNNRKLTVMYANKGKLQGSVYPMSRQMIEQADEVNLHVEGKDGAVLTLTATKEEIFSAVRQTDLDYMEWKAFRQAGTVEEDWVDFHFNRNTIRARLEHEMCG